MSFGNVKEMARGFAAEGAVVYQESENLGRRTWTGKLSRRGGFVIVDYRDEEAREDIRTAIPSSAFFATSEADRGRLVVGYVMVQAWFDDKAAGRPRLPSGRPVEQD